MTAAVAAPAPSSEFYDRWFACLRDASYRQGRAYAALASAKRKASAELIVISRAEEVLGIASVRVRRLPILGIGIAYIDRGPMVSPDGEFDPDRSAIAVDALSEQFVGRRGLVLRIKPPSYAGRADNAMRALLEARGFRELAASPQQSFVLDLAQDLDSIRARFNGKWRGHLSKAERSELTVTRATDQQSFAAFGTLLDRLQQKKGFHSEQDAWFFARCQALGSDAERMTLHLAWSGGRLVAGHLGAYNGDTAVYLLGATSDEGRAARAAYLLQWEVIQFAKALGLRYYDLGGADAAANPDVHGFKERMGGEAIWNTPGFELAPGAFSRLILHAAERLADMRR